MRKANPNRMRRGAKVLLSAGLVLTVAVVSVRAEAGNIQVSNVAQGSAAISRIGSQTTIRAANNTIVNYSKFNVDANEGVKFIQPGAQARMLNRVNSPDPSYLLGSIQANGQVYFVNRAGVIIGPGATINAGQFFAVAGSMKDSDFLNGVNRFTTSGGAVVNNGSIHASDGTVLVGDKVLNTGSIVSEKGLVAMCSGKEVYLAKGDSGVKIRVDNLDASTGVGSQASSGARGAGVSNQGSVNGDEVVFSCGDVYSLAVVNSGQVRAKGGSVTMSGNGVVRNEGRIDVSNRDSGATGGKVKMLGDTVVVQNGSIDASGGAGGGQVLLGGSRQGSGPERNSTLTFVDQNSKIAADAVDTGNGGKVVVWSDGRTGFYGDLSARGAQDGVGGSAEISGHENLGFGGQVDLAGGIGWGSLLLDPDNIEVATGGGGAYTDVNAFAAASGTDVTIDPSTLDGVAGDVILQALNDITITDALTLNTVGAKLTMQAGNNITVNAPVTTTGGAVTMTANDSGGTQSGTGSVLVNSGISTTGNGDTGADITLNVDGGTGSVDLNALLDVGTTGTIQTGTAQTVNVISNAARIQDAISTVAVNGTVNVAAGLYDEDVDINKSITLLGTTTNGAFSVADSWTATPQINLGGNIAANTGGMVFNDAVTLAGATVLGTAGGNISFQGLNGGGFDLTLSAGIGSGTVTFAGAVSNLGSGTGPALTVESGVTGAVAFQNTVAANSGFSSADGSNLEFDNDVTIVGDSNGTFLGGNLTFGTLTFATDGPLVLGTTSSNTVSLNGTGTVFNVTDQDVTVISAVDGASDLTIHAGTGNVAINGTIGGITPPGKLDFGGATVATAAPIISTSDVTLTSTTGDLTLGDNVTTTGTVQFSAPAGAVIQLAGGVVTAGTLNADCANGLYAELDLVGLGLESDPPPGYDNIVFKYSALDLSVDVTGSGKIDVENLYSSDSTIDSLTTAGGNINFYDYVNAGVFVNGPVTSGTGTVNGGDINIVCTGPVTLNAGVDSSTGTGGTLSLIDGVTVNVAPTVGAGNILITGNTSDLYINTAIIGNTDIVLTSTRDIYVRSDIITLGSADMVLTADSDLDGVGGVLIYPSGNVQSAGAITITGSDLYLTPTVVDAIVIQSDPVAAQLTAGGYISLSVSSAAPANSKIQIFGELKTTGLGYCAVYGSGPIELDGSSIPDTYLISAAGAVYFDAPVTLLADTALDSKFLGTGIGFDGNIYFVKTLDGAFDLTLNAGSGYVYGYEDVGSTTPLTGLTITDSAKIQFYNNVATRGQDGQAGGNIDVQCRGDITFGGNIDASGGDAVAGAGLNGGSVSLVSSGGNVVVHGIKTSGSDAVAGTGGDAGDVTLQPSATVTAMGIVPGDYFPAATLEIHGDIIAQGGKGAGAADGSGGHVALSPAGRSNVPAVATISSGTTGGNVTISAGSIAMGQNEKFTVANGNLTLLSKGPIAVGDLTASGNLTIDPGPGVITMLLRDPGVVLLADGFFANDSGLDVVCGGTMNITGNIAYGGVSGGNLPVFAARHSSGPLNAPGSTMLLLSEALEPLTLSTYVLDGTAIGQATGPAISTDAFAEVIPPMPNEDVYPLAVRHWATMLFYGLDSNWDGSLDFKEFAAYFGDKKGLFEAADKNRDGKLSLEEFMALAY